MALLSFFACTFFAVVFAVFGAPLLAFGGASNTIDNVWIIAKDNDSPTYNYDVKYGYADNPNLVQAQISAKGGRFQFGSVIRWSSDWSENLNSSYVTWNTSDSTIASINNTGEATAHKDGTVTITCTVAAANTSTGADLVASCKLKVSGQSDSPYVTGIRIVRGDGSAIDGPVALDDDLSYIMEQFNAYVAVKNPTNGESTTYYVTAGNSLSSQTGGTVSDIRWFVGDTTVGSIDQDLGMYRPTLYGSSTIYCESTAGYDGKTVRDSIVVNVKNPNGTEENNAQDVLNVKAYYELYTPEDHGEEAYVINKTYTLDDLYGLNVGQSTYTARGSGSYWTISAKGVYLKSVLVDAGINLEGVSDFHFDTVDNLPTHVSKSFIFDYERYYFPNMDLGLTAGMESVEPMLAFESVAIKNGSCEPDYDHMLSNTRFRLLFGSTGDSTNSNSQYQIYWIKTIYVVLAGAPAYGDGDGDGDGGGGEGGQSYANGGDTEGDGKTYVVGGTENNSDTGGTDPNSQAGDGTGSETAGTGAKFSIFSVINRHDSVTAELEQPMFFEFVVIPIAILIFVASVLLTIRQFKRETAPVVCKAIPATSECIGSMA